eukprot:1161392-Pelagomonas_calceolata.AAC.2
MQAKPHGARTKCPHPQAQIPFLYASQGFKNYARCFDRPPSGYKNTLEAMMDPALKVHPEDDTPSQSDGEVPGVGSKRIVKRCKLQALPVMPSFASSAAHMLACHHYSALPATCLHAIIVELCQPHHVFIHASNFKLCQPRACMPSYMPHIHPSPLEHCLSSHLTIYGPPPNFTQALAPPEVEPL